MICFPKPRRGAWCELRFRGIIEELANNQRLNTNGGITGRALMDKLYQGVSYED